MPNILLILGTKVDWLRVISCFAFHLCNSSTPIFILHWVSLTWWYGVGFYVCVCIFTLFLRYKCYDVGICTRDLKTKIPKKGLHTAIERSVYWNIPSHDDAKNVENVIGGLHFMFVCAWTYWACKVYGCISIICRYIWVEAMSVGGY